MKKLKIPTRLTTLTAIILLSGVHVYLLSSYPAYAAFLAVWWVVLLIVLIKENTTIKNWLWWRKYNIINWYKVHITKELPF